MENTFSTLAAVVVGGLLAIFGNYIIEAQKSKTAKYTFTRDKKVWVGEVYYRFSGYSLLLFENMLDNLNTMQNYTTEAGQAVIRVIEENLQKLIKKIAEENVTITAADIFFNINGADEAAQMMNKIKHAQATFVEKINSNQNESEITIAFENLKSTIQAQITLIKDDRAEIKNKITLRLGLSNDKPKAKV